MTRCSDCSAEIRPVVAVDIDGTLAGYHWQLERFATAYWDLAIPKSRWNGVGDFEDHLGMTQLQYREAKLAYRQGGYKRVAPMYDRAFEFMNSLRELGLEIWITTTRPWSRLDNVDPDTKFWLSRNNIPYDHLLFDDDKYRVLSEIVDDGRVVAVLDDLPEQYDRAEDELPTAVVLMIERAHNMMNRSGRQTVSTFDEALLKIKPTLERWERYR